MPSWLPVGLFVLACPVAMGLMMFFMMRSMRGQHKQAGHHASEDSSSLQAELTRLEAEKRALERQLPRTEQGRAKGGLPN